MNFTRLWNRLRGLSASAESDLEHELDFHREMKERELRESGVEGEEARYAARRSMGNLTLAREDARSAWTFEWLRDAGRDLRYGARTLASNKPFTITAVLALVLGIGVNATVFNIYNAVMLAPFPVRDAGQTARVLFNRGGKWTGTSWPHFQYLREHSQSLSGLAASTNLGVRVVRGNESWNSLAIAVSGNFFDVLGTGFAVGRGFSQERAAEVVLQHDTWQAHFGANPGVIGEWIQVNGQRLQIAGVAAPGFNGPSADRPALWFTGSWLGVLNPDERKSLESPSHCCVNVSGRLKEGVTRETAQAELAMLGDQFLKSVHEEPVRVLLTRNAPMTNPSIAAKVSPVFFAVLTASLLILLLASANVANLQIARAIARRREITVRLSLGASRWRILRQMLAESLLLGAIAAGLSLAVSAWLPAWLIAAFSPSKEPLAIVFRNDSRVYAFVVALTLTASVAFGLIPAWTAVRSAAGGMRVTSPGSRLRSVLLGFQVALCAILLCGATLLVRALDEARGMDPGFRSAGVVVLHPNLQSSGVKDEDAPGILSPLLARLEGLPGVAAIGHSTVVPLGNSFNTASVDDPRTGRSVRFSVAGVSANFFSTMQIAVLAGQVFAKSEEGRPDTVAVSQALAERLWPGQSAVGRVFPGRTATVAAVVSDASFRELSPERELVLYEPSRGGRGTSILLRCADAAAASALLLGLPKIVREADARFFPSAQSMTGIVKDARHGAVVSASVAAGLSALALLLSCVGIYGVAVYNVAQRIREIGVRVALGARAGGILLMVMRQNLRTVVIGAVAGVAGALALARLLTSLLYGVPPRDPSAIAAAVCILLGTALLATLAPARRAAAVDPAITLRHE